MTSRDVTTMKSGMSFAPSGIKNLLKKAFATELASDAPKLSIHTVH